MSVLKWVRIFYSQSKAVEALIKFKKRLEHEEFKINWVVVYFDKVHDFALSISKEPSTAQEGHEFSISRKNL